MAVSELYVRGWVRLTALALGSGCAGLTALDVSSCANLASLQLQLPALHTLSASACPKLEVVILECPKLRSVSLAQCKAMYTLLAEHSTELQSLNVFGCRGLGADALNALLRVVGPSLRALNLNGAIGTQEVTHEELLVKCPGLARLEDNGRVRKW